MSSYTVFMNLRRGSSGQLKRLEEAWGDTLPPIADPAHDEARVYTQTSCVEERQDMTPTQFLTAASERRRQAHMAKVPLTKYLKGLRFVSHAELSF